MSYYRRKSGTPRRPRKAAKPDVRIEFPSRGATYCKQAFGVYEYGTYGRGSVLAGQQSRKWLGEYETEAEALAAHPDATPSCGCGYQKPYLDHLPDDADY